MSKSLNRCETCGRYTLANKCPDEKCNGRAVSPAPPKYSPEDKYAKYRRQYKKEHRE